MAVTTKRDCHGSPVLAHLLCSPPPLSRFCYIFFPLFPCFQRRHLFHVPSQNGCTTKHLRAAGYQRTPHPPITITSLHRPPPDVRHFGGGWELTGAQQQHSTTPNPTSPQSRTAHPVRQPASHPSIHTYMGTYLCPRKQRMVNASRQARAQRRATIPGRGGELTTQRALNGGGMV
jgi:hypothetical protein